VLTIPIPLSYQPSLLSSSLLLPIHSPREAMVVKNTIKRVIFSNDFNKLQLWQDQATEAWQHKGATLV